MRVIGARTSDSGMLHLGDEVEGQPTANEEWPKWLQDLVFVFPSVIGELIERGTKGRAGVGHLRKPMKDIAGKKNSAYSGWHRCHPRRSPKLFESIQHISGCRSYSSS
jgi:hypothetical protein